MVTVLLPKSEHPNVLGEIVIVGEPQLSFALDTTSFTPMVAAPLEFNATSEITDNAVIDGAVLS